jgi:hypothetical protein
MITSFFGRSQMMLITLKTSNKVFGDVEFLGLNEERVSSIKADAEAWH